MNETENKIIWACVKARDYEFEGLRYRTYCFTRNGKTVADISFEDVFLREQRFVDVYEKECRAWFESITKAVESNISELVTSVEIAKELK